ncbi:MAG TPA: hypothetical protein PLD59_07720 [Tepidisphaeraceae bacterium]|nr:hypothetical protein [Tepidisphaeraceae bacterium]
MNRKAFAIDALEQRQLLANVSVQLADGLLQIAGSSSADKLTVSVSNNTLTVKGATGTTVNGSTAGRSFPKFSVTGIFANLNGGDDVLTLDGVDQGLGGTINAGAGKDTVNIYRSTLHGMLVQGAAGNDNVNLLGTTLQSVVIDTGADNDVVSVLGNTVFNFSSVVLGSGNDTFVAVANTVFGFTSVDGGTGTDTAIGLWNNLPGGSFITGVENRYGI